MLAALPASEADMPATKDFVRAEMTAGFARVDTNLKDLRVEMTEKFATADNKMNDKFATASTEMKRWVIGTGIAFAGVILAAVNTMPG